MAASTDKGIRQVGDRRWEVRVYAGRTLDGKSIVISRGCTGGIKDARALRKKVIAEVAMGKHGTKAGTFGALLDAWLKDGKQGRSPTTLARYRQKIDSVIRPALGDKVLDKLTTKDLDSFYAEEMRNGRSAAMVLEYHRLISAALIQAEKWDMVPVSVARRAQRPTVDKKPIVSPPPEHVVQLIRAAAEGRTPDLAYFITIAAMTGMRRGELCGLQWGDVDWDSSSVTINRAIWQNGGEWGMKVPKTRQIRTVIIDPHCLEALRRRWNDVTDRAAIAEVEIGSDAYVFSPLIAGERPLLPDSATQAFRRLCLAQEGEGWSKYHVHSLRHYAGTELARHGFSGRTIAHRLGHSDPALTMRVYIHDTQDQATAAAAALGSGLAG